MPGLTLGIGETNPKRGAVQFDARRIDAVPFIIPVGAGVMEAPIGSIVTLQEFVGIGMKIVLGGDAYTDVNQNTYSIIGVGFLEAATQTDGQIDQSVGVYKDGDVASMIMDMAAVASVPTLAGSPPASGSVAYITPAGLLTSVSYENVIFPGVVFYTTPGQQVTNQLKAGYCFARILIPAIFDFSPEVI
jgi:hypothetical protein